MTQPLTKAARMATLSGTNRAVTEEVAAWAATVEGTTLADDVAHHGRRLIVDYLAASSAGSTTGLSQKLREYFLHAEPGERSTVIAGPKLSAAAAAYVNGSSAHGLELDDGYTPGSVHPGACVVPAVLAMAEAVEASIDQAVASVLVGVEITARIAAAGHPHVLNSGFHNTPVTGVFGAAAAVTHLLAGGKNEIQNALGLAGSYSGGLREYHAHGSEVKRLHAGKAARDGLKCGEMATFGISAPSTVLEGKQGYFSAFARGQWDPDLLLGDLGTAWVATRTYIKPYPCCRHLHGPIDAALLLRDRTNGDLSSVHAIRVGTYELASRFNRIDPSSLMEAQLSIPYTVAAALKYGTVSLSTFDDAVMNDPEIRHLASLVEICVDAEAEGSYPRERPAEVELLLSTGETARTRIAQPLGEPDHPISDESLSEKFRSLAIPVLGNDRAETAMQEAWSGNNIALITTALGR